MVNETDYYHMEQESLSKSFDMDFTNTEKKFAQYQSLETEPALNVNVTHIPIDWVSITATLGAAFFGALAAFILNGIYEIQKERERRRTVINSAMNELVMNLMFLINFKSQFLTKFNTEFDVIREHAAKYNTLFLNALLVAEFNNKILPMLNLLEKEDPILNGAWMKWDEYEELEIHAPETLGFFCDYFPDDIRIFVLAREQIKGVIRMIKLRNKCWEKHEQNLPFYKQPTPQAMKGIFELLILRKNAQELADRGLVLLKESVQRIEKYNKAHYPKRFILWRKLFKTKNTIKGNFQKEALALIPDREKYINLIEPPIDTKQK